MKRILYVLAVAATSIISQSVGAEVAQPVSTAPPQLPNMPLPPVQQQPQPAILLDPKIVNPPVSIALPDAQQLFNTAMRDIQNLTIRITALEKQVESLMRTSNQNQRTIEERFAQMIKQQQNQPRGAVLAQQMGTNK